jgi:endonuclease/exonuclease/phosphatase family metal-dependent hydrolase
MRLWTIRKPNLTCDFSPRLRSHLYRTLGLLGIIGTLSSCSSVPPSVSNTLAPHRDLASPPSPSLKIVSLNLYQRPWERSERLNGTVIRLKNEAPDVILLQEVSRGIGPWSTDPVQSLLESLPELGHTRGWHEWNLGLYSLGLATLSKPQIQESTSGYRAFETNDLFNTKGYLVTHLPTSPVGEIFFINVHFTHVRNDELKQKQFSELTQRIQKLQELHPHSAIILGGDFNAPPDHLALQSLIQNLQAISWESTLSPEDQKSGTHHSPYSESCQSEPSQSRIDHFLLIQPIQSTHRLKFSQSEIETHSVEPHLSDHCLLMTTLQKVP